MSAAAADEGAGGVRPTFAELTLPGPSGLEVRWPDGVVIRGASVEDVAKLEPFQRARGRAKPEGLARTMKSLTCATSSPG